MDSPEHIRQRVSERLVGNLHIRAFQNVLEPKTGPIRLLPQGLGRRCLPRRRQEPQHGRSQLHPALERMGIAGYDGVKWILRSADYGSPQLRMRAFFVAWRRGFPGAAVLKQPPTPTHYSPRWDQPPPGLRPAVHAEMVERAQAAKQAWVGAMERANGGCCYGMWSCNWINNINRRCEGCFRGSDYLESPHARDIAFPPGPRVRWYRDADGVHYAEVSHKRLSELVQQMAAAVVPKAGARRTHQSIQRITEAYRKAPVHSWWRLDNDAPVHLQEPPRAIEAVPIAEVSREAMGQLLQARWPKALTGRALKLIPERTVARRRLQFRRQPKQLRYAKVLDRAQRMVGRHRSFLTPALLARSYAAMGGTIYATTDDGEDGIESLRGASVLEHMTAMGLPSWFAPGVTEAPKGDIFTAMGNGVPVELGRAVARQVWKAFGREVLEEPVGAGLWATGEEPGVEPGRADYTWCETAQHVHDEIGGAGWKADRWFEVGQEMDYGEPDDEEDEDDLAGW